MATPPAFRGMVCTCTDRGGGWHLEGGRDREPGTPPRAHGQRAANRRGTRGRAAARLARLPAPQSARSFHQSMVYEQYHMVVIQVSADVAVHARTGGCIFIGESSAPAPPALRVLTVAPVAASISSSATLVAVELSVVVPSPTRVTRMLPGVKAAPFADAAQAAAAMAARSSRVDELAGAIAIAAHGAADGYLVRTQLQLKRVVGPPDVPRGLATQRYMKRTLGVVAFAAGDCVSCAVTPADGEGRKAVDWSRVVGAVTSQRGSQPRRDRTLLPATRTADMAPLCTRGTPHHRLRAATRGYYCFRTCVWVRLLTCAWPRLVRRNVQRLLLARRHGHLQYYSLVAAAPSCARAASLAPTWRPRWRRSLVRGRRCAAARPSPCCHRGQSSVAARTRGRCRC